MDNNEILGYFDGKDIFLDIGNNLRNGLSPSTYIHEIAHKVLNQFCGIGILENMIKEHMEMNDKSKNEVLFKCILSEISKFTYEIHEIYANTIEMIEIKRIFGNETWNKIYSIKPDAYKTYANYYLDIISLNIDVNKAKAIILDHCVAALYLNVLSDEFINALNNPESFIKYMNSQDNPLVKLDQLKDNYIKYKLPIDKKIIYFVSHKELMIRLQTETPIKNDDGCYFEFMIKMYSDMFQNEKLRNIFEKMSSSDIIQLIGNDIKLLDLSSIRPVPLPADVFFHKAQGVIHIINRFELRGYKPKEEEFYIIFLDIDSCIYYSTIAGECYITKLLEQKNIFGAMILSEEFSEDFSIHKYLSSIQKDKYVILRDYTSSIKLLSKYILNHEVFYTSIDEDSGHGVITIFIFRDRENDELLFVFPTTKNVAAELIMMIGDSGEFLDSKNFETIFSKRNGLLSFGHLMLYLFWRLRKSRRFR